jgi:hypothetical protein
MRRLMLLGVALLSGVAQGATVVPDQDTGAAGTSNTSYAVLRIHTMVQTFTVGVSGKLDSVDVRVIREQYAHEDLVLSIWTAGSDGLRQDLLGTVSKSPDDFIGIPLSLNFQEFDLSALNIAVSEGDTLAIALDSAAVQSFVSPQERYFWNRTVDSTAYDGGNAYGCSKENPQSCLEFDWDFNLRTHVQVVPLPASALLFGSALTVFGWFGRRRKRRA